MTKRKFRSLEEMVNRPWCYYCERDFEDLSTLVDHQKSKHFKCHCCSRRLNTAGGVRVHMQQVHKETLTHIKDCINDERANPDIEIFGMEGVPEDLKEEFKQKITAMWFASPAAAQAKEAEARVQAQANKKPRIEETAEELKARQKALIAKKRAEKAAKAAGQSTPNAAPTTNVSTPREDATSTAGASPSNGYNPHSASFAESAAFGRDASNSPFQPITAAGYGAPPHAAAYPGYGATPPQYAVAGSPAVPQSFTPYSQPGMGPGFPGYAGPPVHGYAPQFAPSVSPPAHMPRGPPHYQQQQPPTVFPQGPYPPARTQSGSSASPVIPGLPARPTFDSPNLSKEQMASMHTPGQPNQPAQFTQPNQPVQFTQQSYGTPSAGSYAGPNHHGGHQMHKPHQNAVRPPQPQAQHGQAPVHDDVQQLIDSVTGQAAASGNATTHGGLASTVQASVTPSTAHAPTSAAKPHETATPEAVAEPKKAGKIALKTVLVYKDKFLSPEEKMAKLSKYAVDLTEINKPQMVLGEGGDAVTGSLGETVRDPQD